jgi:hypothetical protein
MYPDSISTRVGLFCHLFCMLHSWRCYRWSVCLKEEQPGAVVPMANLDQISQLEPSPMLGTAANSPYVGGLVEWSISA